MKKNNLKKGVLEACFGSNLGATLLIPHCTGLTNCYLLPIKTVEFLDVPVIWYLGAVQLYVKCMLQAQGAAEKPLALVALYNCTS